MSAIVFYLFDGLLVDEDDEDEHLIYLYGREVSGASVTVVVRGFRPYVFELERSMKPLPPCECQTEPQRRRLAYGYHATAEKFLKVRFKKFKEYRKHGRGKYMYDPRNVFLLFLHERNIRTSSWVRIERAKASTTATTTSAVYTASIHGVGPLTENVPKRLPPLMVCSFDLETYNEEHKFPVSKQPRDVILCIGMVFSAYPFADMQRVLLTTKPSAKVEGTEICVFESEGLMLDAFAQWVQKMDVDVFTGYNIFGFDYAYLCDRALRLGNPRWLRVPKESRWADLRAEVLKNKDQLDKCTEVQRLWGVYDDYAQATAAAAAFEKTRPCRQFYWQNRRDSAPLSSYVTKYTNTAAKGQNTTHRILREGRVDVDLLPYARSNLKLLNYKLETVARHILGDHKADLPYAVMFQKWESGTPEDVAEIVKYCVQDCVLPVTLLKKLNVLENMTEMSYVTSTNLDDVINGGQQKKSYNLLRRFLLDADFVMDEATVERPDDLQGATVLPPKAGFYSQPIATLDFASLYPSIMRAHNLCYTTIVLNPAEKARLRPSDVETIDTGRETFTYVKPHVRRGILPEILGSLLSQRKQAKRDMKKATDPLEKSVQNGRQLALKVTANSLYGFTGVDKGYWPCYPIAISVTATGRCMIEECKTITREHFPNSTCVYGDTDSIMVSFHDCENSVAGMQTCFRHGEVLADILTDFFKQKTQTPHVVMEMEKACWPFLAFPVKKRYISRYFEDPQGKPKIDAKGVQLARTDGSQLLRDVYKEVVENIIPLDGDVKDVAVIEADVLRIVRSQLERIRDMEVPMFVIQKTLKTEYKNGGDTIPQVALWKKLLQAIENKEIMMEPPRSGDKLPFVVLYDKDKKKKIFDRVAHPDFTRKEDLDITYYIENQLRNAITQLCEPFTDKMDALFDEFVHQEKRQRAGLQDISKFFNARPAATLPAAKKRKVVKKKKSAVPSNSITKYF